jgi:Leucine-rich repeat (LRR) protein
MEIARVLASLLAVTLACCQAIAAPPSDDALAAAGATIKKNDAGAIVEVRFKGPAVDPEILAGLPELPALTSVVLAGTDADDAALVPLGKIATLKNLDLRDCPVTNAGLAHLTGLENLAALRLSGKSGRTTVDDAGMEHVAKLTSLRAVMLDFLWVSEVGLETLTALEKLEDLTLAQTLAGDDAVPVIAKFPALQRLRLAKTGVTGSGLAALEPLTNLRDLDLSECASLDDAALEPVGTLVTLERLNLWRVPVGDSGIAHITPLVKLRWLNLDNTLLSDAGLEALSGMKDLEFLHVGSTAVSNAGIDRLAALPALRELHLTRTAVDAAGATELRAKLPETRVIVESGGE